MEKICYYTDPNKTIARQLNDFRLVALTSVIATWMERIVSDQRISSVVDQMASFIYKKNLY